MKRLKAARHPQHFLDPLQVSNRTHSFEDGNLFGVGLNASWETMYPNSMPRGTPKTHFSGFSFTPLLRRQLNAMRRLSTRSFAFQVFTTISSTYASTVRPMWSPKMCYIHHWYVVPAFRRPNDIVT
jgi:hypothetical protein